MQVNSAEKKVNAGVAPYSTSYQRYLIKTILEDAAGPGSLVRVFMAKEYLQFLSGNKIGNPKSIELWGVL